LLNFKSKKLHSNQFATGQMFPLYCIENFFLKKNIFFLKKKEKKAEKQKKYVSLELEK